MPKFVFDRRRATRSRPQAAALLGCSVPMLRGLIADGTLQAVQIGNQTRLTVASIELALGKPIAELEGWDQPRKTITT